MAVKTLDASVAVPILFFLTAEPRGANLTVFGSEQAVEAEMDVWLAREAPNATFDASGRRLTFEYRNDSAREFFGGKLMVGGREYALVRPSGDEAAASEPTLVARLREWLVSRTGSEHDEAGMDELIRLCVEAGAPVRG